MGSTEGGYTGMQLSHDGGKDWSYFYFDPDFSDIEFREYSEGLYEAIQIRKPETEKYHAIWTTFPDLHERSTSDMYSKHPTKPNLWRFEGRTDDLITFARGEKHNPQVYEEEIRTNPLVKAAMIVGTGHQQAALLIQLRDSPPTTPEARQDILQKVLPSIEKANAEAPRHAVVLPTHVIFASAEKPFKLAGKGTIQRAPTVKDYEKEIEELYAREGDKKLDSHLAHLNGVQGD